jgi:acetyl esterase/lipase
MKPVQAIWPLLALLAAPLALGAAAATPQEIRLWPGKAPGTEKWTVPESVTTSQSGDRTVSNVSDPTLTVFLPDPAIATGTAVVLAPGGAMRVLGIDGNGTHIAKWLNAKGIAAFVLKYRTVQQAAGGRGGGGPGAVAGAGGAPRAGGPGGAPQRQEMEIRNANANPEPNDAALTEAVQMAIADGQAALRLIRKNAKEWKVDPARVGIMGFSAGGGVAVGTALGEKNDAYPDFLMSMYGPSLVDVNVPAHAPPLFIAVGSTHFNVTNGCLALFAAWKAAGKPAEIHVYDGVSAGFGLAKRGLPVDGWIDRAYEWLVARKLTEAR